MTSKFDLIADILQAQALINRNFDPTKYGELETNPASCFDALDDLSADDLDLVWARTQAELSQYTRQLAGFKQNEITLKP